MKKRRTRTPQIWVKCTRCKRSYLRYDYGKGRRRTRHYGVGKRSFYSESAKVSVKCACIHCRGQVEIT